MLAVIQLTMSPPRADTLGARFCIALLNQICKIQTELSLEEHMPDTIRKHFPGIACSDCGIVNVYYFHQRGALVPVGTSGYFCPDCFTVRSTRFQSSQTPLPIGETTYTERCRGKRVLITFPRGRDAVRTFVLLMFASKLDTTVIPYNNGNAERCDFFWRDDFDSTEVDKVLKELRLQYPDIAITDYHYC